ncbi:olfactory receptor 6M1-like [Gopherus flavomarginatus]|uniref:olfactory receptor 6M1-like n=1 Tax=Gopherus flavomarginatus TaxID=286002 RepID=UPI0021CBF2CF|nr:olfactory receptor 6M1-like [Gopherus flavomarginatus]
MSCVTGQKNPRNNYLVCLCSHYYFILFKSICQKLDIRAFSSSSILQAKAEIRTNNQSNVVMEFVLLGFSLSQPMELLVFMLLLAIFALTLMGNMAIITVVYVDLRLHTPMYFFLCNLSLLEILFVLSITPKMLENLLSQAKAISFWGCITQCYFSFFLGTADFILIAVMSFDCYVAICHPLHYPVIMSGLVCVFLVMGCWLFGFLSPLCPLILLCQLPFCGPNVINHFFCDYAPLVKLTCVDTHFLLMIEYVLSSMVLLTSLSFTAVSYLYIIATVLHIPSATSRRKAFSTCTSHIMVASIFYGSAIFLYARPSQGRSLDFQKVVAVFNVIVSPLLNPFIYALRNEKVKEALKEYLTRKSSVL